MIIKTEQISFDSPWRFAFVPEDMFDEAVEADIKWLEIDGSSVHCMQL